VVILVFRTYPGFPDLILVFLKFNKKSWLSWFFGLILVFRPLSCFFCPCPGLSCKQMIFLRCRMIFLNLIKNRGYPGFSDLSWFSGPYPVFFVLVLVCLADKWYSSGVGWYSWYSITVTGIHLRNMSDPLWLLVYPSPFLLSCRYLCSLLTFLFFFLWGSIGLVSVGRGSCGPKRTNLLPAPFLFSYFPSLSYFGSVLFSFYGGLHKVFDKLGAPTYWLIDLSGGVPRLTDYYLLHHLGIESGLIIARSISWNLMYYVKNSE